MVALVGVVEPLAPAVAPLFDVAADDVAAGFARRTSPSTAAATEARIECLSEGIRAPPFDEGTAAIIDRPLEDLEIQSGLAVRRALQLEG